MGFMLSWGAKPQYVERDNVGNWFYQIFSPFFDFKRGEINSAQGRFDAVFNNPAVLLNFRLISDLGSLARVHEYKDNKINTPDILYTLKKKPNFFQSWEQFIKDYYYWVSMGTAYLYDPTINNNFSEKDNLYWLHPHRMVFTDNQINILGGLINSEKGYKDLMQTKVTYYQPNGKKVQIPLKYIKPFFSISNGLKDNWFEGGSVLDTLYKIIAISNESLEAWAVNLKYTKKFGVSAKKDNTSLNDFNPMGDTEREDIERKIASKKEVTVSKTPLNIERYVKDIASLKLDDAFLTTYFIIGKMLGIPKDVSEAYINSGATFENQEKSSIKFVSMALQPLGDNLVAHFMNEWNKEDWRITWEHLPMMQVANADKENSRKTALENLQQAVNLGLKEADKERILKEIME